MAQTGLSVPTYAYGLNNPVRYTDPNGRNPVLAAPALYYGLVGIAAFTAWYYAYTQQHPILLPQIPTDVFAKKQPSLGSDKPDGCPTGTKAIDQYPGLDKDKIHGIKKGVGAKPADWTGIDPEGNVWTGDGEGGAENHGPFDSYLP